MNETMTVMERNKAHMAVKPSALNAMARRYSMDPTNLLHTLKNTVFKGATNEQLGALVVVANEHGLNPFTREIYAFPDKAGGIQAVVGVDGWLRIINSNPNFDGVEFEQTDDVCTCILFVKGRSHAIKITEYMSECRRNTDPWKTYPKRMLRHKALIQAARVGFGYGSLLSDDEVQMHPASSTVTVLDRVPEADQYDSPSGQPAPDTGPDPEQDNPDDGDLSPQPKRGPKATPQSELAKFVVDSGYTFDDFQAWGESEGVVPDAGSYAGFDDVPDGLAKRLLRAKVGMLQGLETGKGGKP